MTELEYLQQINQEPTPDMVKQGNGYKYIPKSILQEQLIRIYNGHYQWEMIRDTVSKNGIWGTGVLKIMHPISKEWLSYSGLAYIPHEKAMKLNYPSMEAQCFKNACKKIGTWFGMKLNIEIEDAEPQDEEPKHEVKTINRKDERMALLIENCKTIEELGSLKPNVTDTTRTQYQEKLKSLTKPIL